jgi:A/G-specific adenine glycosylase
MRVAVHGATRKESKSEAAGTSDPEALLAWYDRHARVLPWRARRGERANPYRVWLSEIMLQQTTVRAVAPYFARIVTRWPDVQTLATASLEDVLREWAGLGYYARARNLHACAREVVKSCGSIFPRDEHELRNLPGIGSYTAAAIAAIAYDAPTLPIDGNIERVVSRLFALEEQFPAGKPRLRALADALKPPHRFGDFAQALMDLGATICTPKNPACALCPWNASCRAFERGDQESFPRKAPKQEGVLRKGAAFVVVRADGRVLLQRRPKTGLLGGMSEVPGSEWSPDFEPAKARAAAPDLGTATRWRRKVGVVNHVFTHFPLQLTIFVTEAPRDTKAPKGARWVPINRLKQEALPNLMRKVIAHALGKDRGGRHGGQRGLDGKLALSGPVNHRAP